MKELTNEQKKVLYISSAFGIAGLISFIIAGISFFIRKSRVAQLDELKEGSLEYMQNHVALESTISTCNILMILFIIIGIGALAMSMFFIRKSNAFSKEAQK